MELSAEKYRTQGNLGCLLGGLGQELSGISEVFRRRVEECFRLIEDEIAHCLSLAVARGDLPASADPHAMAELLVNCWEGAALRSRLRRDPAPLMDMLGFYFGLVAAQVDAGPRSPSSPSRRGRSNHPVRSARLTTRGAKT